LANTKVACVQCDVTYANVGINASNALAQFTNLRAAGVDLVVFPEAALTGYCTGSASEAARIAISNDHGAIHELERAVTTLGGILVIGFAERDGNLLYNSVALFESGREPRLYRKTHLPHLGLDRFVDPGDSIDVFETQVGKIGVLICFDQRFPEASRKLALRGAEIIVVPTNWPVGAEVSAEHIAIARAAENRVFVATCNRVGEENGFKFIGRSKIISPNGEVLAEAGAGAEVIIGELDLSDARIKRRVVIPGEYETDVFSSRRPDLYN